MGYYVNIISCAITIPTYLFPTICNHLLTSDFLNPKYMGGGAWGGDEDGKRWFSWCDMEKLESSLKSNDLIAVLECFRFEPSTDDLGNIIDLWFDCKHGDEEHLFTYIAQVLPGIHRITWQGEGGEQWRWVIRNNELTTVNGTTIFPGDVL